MSEGLALTIVVAVGAFFAALGGASLLAPPHASRFLLGFAGSASKHYAELGLRFLAGSAFVLAAPTIPFPSAFRFFGWILVATTAGLLLIPWRWHRRFAQRAVPVAVRFLPMVGATAFALGLLILLAVYLGQAA